MELRDMYVRGTWLMCEAGATIKASTAFEPWIDTPAKLPCRAYYELQHLQSGNK